MANTQLKTIDINKVIQSLTLGQKMTLGAFVFVVALISAGFYLSIERNTTYVPVSSSINPSEIDKVIQAIEQIGIKYKTQNGGSTILVPEDEVERVKLQFAREDILQGQEDFSLFDKNTFGMTDATLQIQKQRALEGKLSKALSALKPISWAQVQLSLEEKSPFLSRKTPAKASVILYIIPGKDINEQELLGISRYVANSVPGLVFNNVTLIDQYGKPLIDPIPEDRTVAISSYQLKLQQQVENHLHQNVLKLLEPVVGKGNIRVSVSVQLNKDTLKRETTTYEADDAATRSKEISTKNSTGTSTTGVPGTASNLLPADGTTNTGTAGSNGSNSKETVNYEIPKTVEHLVLNPGNITFISMAVLLNYQSVTAADGAVTANPWNAADLASMQDQVEAAVGINSANRTADKLTITSLPFEAPINPAVLDNANMQKYINWGLQAIIPFVWLIGLILFYRVIIRPFVNRVVKPLLAQPDIIYPTDEEALPRITAPKTVNELEAELAAELDSEMGFAPVTKEDIIKKRIVEMLEADPESSANLIRSWLSEED